MEGVCFDLKIELCIVVDFGLHLLASLELTGYSFAGVTALTRLICVGLFEMPHECIVKSRKKCLT